MIDYLEFWICCLAIGGLIYMIYCLNKSAKDQKFRSNYEKRFEWDNKKD